MNIINILLFGLLGFFTGIFGLLWWEMLIVFVIAAFIGLNAEENK